MKSTLSFLILILSALLFYSPQLVAQSNTLPAQQVLSRLGYYQGPIDGSMGSATSAAIRRFQVANQLRPTGILTPETIEGLGLSLRSSGKSNGSSLHTAALTVHASSSPAADTKALTNMFIGGPLLAASPEIQVATVEKAQRNLQLLGYYSGPINGLPDANLKAALNSYQKDSRFKRTGRLDKITLMGLNILPGSYQPGQ
jgi:peptidoglycan hydrolase-like protein with peptidoglycan-binding domain